MATQARKVLSLTLDHAVSYRDSLRAAPVSPTASRDELRTRLDLPLSDEGLPPEQVIAELIAGVEGGIMASGGGRFFAWVIGGSVEAALAADWLAAAWDQNSATYQSGPAAALVEEIAGRWLKEMLGV